MGVSLGRADELKQLVKAMVLRDSAAKLKAHQCDTAAAEVHNLMHDELEKHYAPFCVRADTPLALASVRRGALRLRRRIAADMWNIRRTNRRLRASVLELGDRIQAFRRYVQFR